MCEDTWSKAHKITTFNNSHRDMTSCQRKNQEKSFRCEDRGAGRKEKTIINV
jgi:hypothetical protein